MSDDNEAGVVAPVDEWSELWERQPGESPEAFEAFALYRDMGIERSTAKVGRRLGKSKTLMDRWSSDHGWVMRAAVWEREQDRKRQQAHFDEIARVEKAQAQRVGVALAALTRPLNALFKYLSEHPQAFVIRDKENPDAQYTLPELLDLTLRVLPHITNAQHEEARLLGVPERITETIVTGTVNVETDNVTRLIVNDPVASELAADLLRQLDHLATDSGGTGDAAERREVEAGSAP